MEILEHLPLVEAPDAIWLSIEAALPGQQSSQTFVARQSIAN
jgi:hypothetical protein